MRFNHHTPNKKLLLFVAILLVVTAIFLIVMATTTCSKQEPSPRPIHTRTKAESMPCKQNERVANNDENEYNPFAYNVDTLPLEDSSESTTYIDIDNDIYDTCEPNIPVEEAITEVIEQTTLPPTVKEPAWDDNPSPDQNTPPIFNKKDNQRKVVPRRDNPSIDYNIGKDKLRQPSYYILLIILLVIYIISRIMEGHGPLIIWATPLDKAIVIIAAVLYFIAMCIADIRGSTTLQISLTTLSGLLMAISVILSIIANRWSILNIILSILSKLFVFVLVNFSILLLIVLLFIHLLLNMVRHSHYNNDYH